MYYTGQDPAEDVTVLRTTLYMGTGTKMGHVRVVRHRPLVLVLVLVLLLGVAHIASALWVGVGSEVPEGAAGCDATRRQQPMHPGDRSR
jgi:hypothetical protein